MARALSLARASSAPDARDAGSPVRSRVVVIAGVGTLAGAALCAWTLARFGLGWRGATWALAQLLLVFVACFDVATRRIPNRAVLPAAVVVLLLRAVFTPGTLAQAAVAGVAAFLGFLALAAATRGGFGMGDVKLAGLLGLLLGKAVLAALFVGVVAGGLGSAVAVVVHRGGRGRTLAYGPYLCLGAALAILAFEPPSLV